MVLCGVGVWLVAGFGGGSVIYLGVWRMGVCKGQVVGIRGVF